MKARSPMQVRRGKTSPPRRQKPPSSQPNSPAFPKAAWLAIKAAGVRPSRHCLTVSIARQEVIWWQATNPLPTKSSGSRPPYRFMMRYVASTSRFGIGQQMGSNCTPLGLHFIAKKIGGDQPIGTVFKGRRPVGLMDAVTEANIVHRILWLRGLEAGFNRGGEVDSFRRYIYIHGFGDESTLGQPASCGCVHLAARDLIPLFEIVPVRALVWIGRD